MAAEQAAGGGGDAFPPFDPHTYPTSILWLIVTFGILYFTMSRYALPRVGSILKERSDKIHERLAAARKMREQAREASDAYDRTLAEARARSQDLANETRNRVKSEQEGKRKALEAELDDKLKAAELRIAETKATAMASVGQIATDTAAAIVEHLTGKPVNHDQVAKAIADSRA